MLEKCDLSVMEPENIANEIRIAFQSLSANPEMSSKNLDIVVFLGNTGSGKSTLINFLANKNLKRGENGNYILDPNINDPEAMVIGVTGNSETLYPKSIDVEGLRLFDLPGFDDTDGSVRNLVNSAFIRQILLDALSVRIVYVAQIAEFEAIRGRPINEMFQCIKKLFISEQNIIDEGLLCCNKMACDNGTIYDLLLQKTHSPDKEELRQQLQSWNNRGAIAGMYCALLDKNNNAQLRAEIISQIKQLAPTQIGGINVSVLYPQRMQEELEKMFYCVMETTRVEYFQVSLEKTLLSEIDEQLGIFSVNDYWQKFDTNLCQKEGAIRLIRDFATDPYNRTIEKFCLQNEPARQDHIRSLREKRQERVRNLQKKTEEKAIDIILETARPFLTPEKTVDDWPPLLFASYLKDFYERVCGMNSIAELATDPKEQECVRQAYSLFISERVAHQMNVWNERVNGERIDKLERKMNNFVIFLICFGCFLLFYWVLF